MLWTATTLQLTHSRILESGRAAKENCVGNVSKTNPEKGVRRSCWLGFLAACADSSAKTVLKLNKGALRHAKTQAPEPITFRNIRMSDRQWIIFNQLGGAEWLRTFLEKKAPMPKQYYDNELARINNPADAIFLNKRREIND